MAADPEVRCELEQIEREFAPAEEDGLGRYNGHSAGEIYLVD